MQDRLLYFPTRVSVSQAAGGALQAWPDAQTFRGLLAPVAGVPRGSVIVFHGNAGQAGDRGYYVQALAPLGLRVILAEYPGYVAAAAARAGGSADTAGIAQGADRPSAARIAQGPRTEP